MYDPLTVLSIVEMVIVFAKRLLRARVNTRVAYPSNRIAGIADSGLSSVTMRQLLVSPD